jgi:hypothetical protein
MDGGGIWISTCEQSVAGLTIGSEGTKTEISTAGERCSALERREIKMQSLSPPSWMGAEYGYQHWTIEPAALKYRLS